MSDNPQTITPPFPKNWSKPLGPYDVPFMGLTDTALDLKPLTRWQRFVRWLQWS